MTIGGGFSGRLSAVPSTTIGAGVAVTLPSGQGRFGIPGALLRGPVDAGRLASPQGYLDYVYFGKQAVQSLANGAWTRINYEVEFAPGAGYVQVGSGWRYVVPAGGILTVQAVLLLAQAVWPVNSTFQMLVAVDEPGGLIRAQTRYGDLDGADDAAGVTQFNGSNIAVALAVEPWQEVSVWFRQLSGAARNSYNDPGLAHNSVVLRLAPR